MEKVTLIVNARNRFSTTSRCLEELIAHSPEAAEIIAVMGGAPAHLKKEWQARFGDKVRFIFKPDFLGQTQAHNIGLREAATKLAVILDSDVYVRPGWLEPLIRCRQETGAVMATPIILEPGERIHCLGNNLYITEKNGKRYASKVFPYHGMVLGERSNLKRQRVDYGEIHCQLVAIEPTLRLNALDEQILEGPEMDSGLTWAKAGLEAWAEPASVVFLDLKAPITADDIGLFVWRWDMRNILEGYRYFEKKWGIDMTEYGGFRDFLVRYNSQLGWLPRRFPSQWALMLDKRIGGIKGLGSDILRIPKDSYRRYKARKLGYFEWPVPTESQEKASAY